MEVFLFTRLWDWCGGNVLIMEKKGGKKREEKWPVGLSCIKWEGKMAVTKEVLSLCSLQSVCVRVYDMFGAFIPSYMVLHSLSNTQHFSFEYAMGSQIRREWPNQPSLFLSLLYIHLCLWGFGFSSSTRIVFSSHFVSPFTLL